MIAALLLSREDFDGFLRVAVTGGGDGGGEVGVEILASANNTGDYDYEMLAPQP